MSIAEKLTTIAENQQRVYDAGFAAGQGEGGGTETAFQHIPSTKDLSNFFARLTFPTGAELLFKLNSPPLTLYRIFYLSVGHRKLIIDIPTTQAYPANGFIQGSSSKTSTIEELVLPDNIKFSDFSYFAASCVKLRTIAGAIDLSESETNGMCFMDCSSLVDVEFVPGTITKSIYFKHSTRLSAESIQFIVDGLAPADTVQDLSLPTTVINKLTPEQQLTILNNNFQAI